jgi:hypothetical protein
MNARSRRVILALCTSLGAAAIVELLTGEIPWLAFAGWVIFFASLQYGYVFPEHSARCTAWLRRGGSDVKGS